MVGAVGRGALEMGGRGRSGASPGQGSRWDHSSLCRLCSRETRVCLVPRELLVLSGSLVSKALEEKWVSQAPAENG